MKLDVISSSSSGNCIILNGDIMFDCGVPINKILQNCMPRVCFLTHSHKDHSQSASRVINYGTHIICHDITAKELKLEHIRLNKFQNLGFKQFQDIKFFPFPCVHDVECWGFLIYYQDKKIAYITDTKYITASLPDLDLLICEINHDKIKSSDKKRVMETHMNISTFEDYFLKREIIVKNLLISHMSDRNANENNIIERVKKIKRIKNVFIANSGLSISICSSNYES